MFTRNNITPAKLENSSGSGHTLYKTSNQTAKTNTRIVFMQGSGDKQKLLGILDFSGSDITVLDTIQTGINFSIRVNSTTDFILSQDDSLKIPVGYDVVRYGRTVLSYPPGLWNNIAASDIKSIQPGDTLRFTLENRNDNVWWYKEISIIGAHGQRNQILAKETIPKRNSLSQNFPNPFNPTTSINYELKEDGFVTLKIYDLLGREVAELVNENETAGRYKVTFNAANFASGIYIYQLRSNDFVANKKLMLMK